MSEGYAPPSGPQFQAPPSLPHPFPAGAQPAHPYRPSPFPGPSPVAVVPAPVTAARGPWSPAAAGPPQRPAVIALGSSLAVVASLQWICGLSLFWVVATVGTGAFAQIGDNGAVFHILNRFNYRMLDGLALPLYLFPLASFVTGFLVLSRRRWARTVHTALGLVALAWAAWWLRDDLLWWFSAAWYVVVACLVLWTPAATAWYRWRADAERLQPPG
jgi:hypothetical protein